MYMDEATKNQLRHLAELIRNPLSDQNNVTRKKKELEWVNTANWTQGDWQLYHSAFK